MAELSDLELQNSTLERILKVNKFNPLYPGAHQRESGLWIVVKWESQPLSSKCKRSAGFMPPLGILPGLMTSPWVLRLCRFSGKVSDPCEHTCRWDPIHVLRFDPQTTQSVTHTRFVSNKPQGCLWLYSENSRVMRRFYHSLRLLPHSQGPHVHLQMNRCYHILTKPGPCGLVFPGIDRDSAAGVMLPSVTRLS